MHTWFSHGASLSPKRSTQDRRDSVVSAAVWGWLDLVHTWFSHGAPLSPKRSRQDQRDSVVSAAVWGWLDLVHTWFSHGASLSPKWSKQDQRDSGVSAAVGVAGSFFPFPPPPPLPLPYGTPGPRWVFSPITEEDCCTIVPVWVDATRCRGSL